MSKMRHGSKQNLTRLEKLFQEALDIRLDALGELHPDTARFHLRHGACLQGSWRL